MHRGENPLLRTNLENMMIKDNPVKIYVNDTVVESTVSKVKKGDQFSFVNDNPDEIMLAERDAIVSGDTWGIVVKE